MDAPPPPTRLAALLTRLERSLATGLGWKLPLAVAVLLGHTTLQGLQMDDFSLQIAQRTSALWAPMHRAPWALFSFFRHDPAALAWARQIGIAAWWSDLNVHLEFFRPLSSLTHAFDLAVLGGVPWAMHLHSLV